MSKPKSDIMNVVGLLMNIAIGIVKAVYEKGGTDDDIRRLAGEEGKDLVAKIADLIVGKARQVFKVTVDYSKSLAEMIKAGRYGWVNDAIVADHFSVQGEGQNKVEVALFHFNRNISSDDAIAEMGKAGYRPARIEELLALGVSQPELQKKFPIVALGSVWRSPHGRRGVPCLLWDGARRDLDLGWFGIGWDVDCRFAAVRKS